MVAVDTTRPLGLVSQAALGQVLDWEFDGMGSFDPTSGHFYPAFVRQLTEVVRPGSLRYPGGIESDTFHWERAIGPEAQRNPNAYGPSSGPSASTVGPDEFGQLLDGTGATGVVTTNFGTGTAQEAANFVSYMTGPVGTSKWADLRAKNGHPKPYDVAWWGVGNEANQPSELYWRGGVPVSVGGPPGACQSVVTCLYIYGGSTRFTKQAVVGYADRRPRASFSSGADGQNFYAAYPPVVSSSATVYVGGSAWKRVSSLGAAGPDSHVFVLDPSSGRITFGDGAHGAVPASGAVVRLSYVSGPHDGFLQFYKAMKNADPSIRVCSSDADTAFLKSMGSSLPYDCLQQDSYASVGTVANGTEIGGYEREIMAAPQRLAQGTATPGGHRPALRRPRRARRRDGVRPAPQLQPGWPPVLPLLVRRGVAKREPARRVDPHGHPRGRPTAGCRRHPGGVTMLRRAAGRGSVRQHRRHRYARPEHSPRGDG